MPPQPLPPTHWDFDREHWPQQDFVGAGADLQPSTLIHAYRLGLFPMPHEIDLVGTAPIGWWSPIQRGVLRLADLKVSRSLRKSRARFTVTVDESFEDVVRACADPSRSGAWIDEEILEAYVRLHNLGWAHSIETRDSDGTLAGGLYGVAIGGLFAGESMFHRATDASKVALMGLVDVLSDEYAAERLIDVQWQTPHLATLGVTTMSRADYLDALESLVEVPLPALWR